MTPDKNRDPPRTMAIEMLHLFVLFAFAVSQPLFDLLGQYPQFFVAHRSNPLDIAVMITILCIVIPAVITMIVRGLSIFGKRSAMISHLSVIGALSALILLPILKRLGDLPGFSSLIAAGAFGLCVAIAYRRFQALRTFLTLLSIALVVFPVLFVVNLANARIFLSETSPTTTVHSATVSNTPVVLVVFDEFSGISLMDQEGRIDDVRFPNFAALAEHAIWFPNATAVTSATEYAVPTILTGQYPRDASRLPLASHYPDNLFSLLANTHELNVFENVTQLCAARACGEPSTRESAADRMKLLFHDMLVVYLQLVIPRDLTFGLPPITRNWKFAPIRTRAINELRSDRPERFRTFVDSIKNESRPSLNFLHILLPHDPYQYFPSGKHYTTDLRIAGLEGDRWVDNPDLVASAQRRYLLQVGLADSLVGDLIARLKAQNLYDRSLVVLTADHGVSFQPGDMRRSITETNFQDILSVPLFVKLPGQQQGKVDVRDTEITAVLPTIAAILGLSIDWEIDGRSLLKPDVATNADKQVFFVDSKKLESTRSVVSANEFRRAKTKSITRQTALMSVGNDRGELQGAGDGSRLVGMSVDELGVAGEAEWVVEVANEQSLTNANPESLLLPFHEKNSVFIPAHIRGRALPLEDEQEHGPVALAIAVDGIVRATVLVKGQGKDKGLFSVVLPESVMSQGTRLSLYVVQNSSSSLMRPKAIRTLW